MKNHHVVPMKAASSILDEDIGVAHAGSTAYAARFTNKVTLEAISPDSPSIESHNGHIYIAWKGDRSSNINVICSSDNGRTFGGTFNSQDTSSQAPALCSHNGMLFISWTCVKTCYLNVARVTLAGSSITGLSNKITLPFASAVRPSLASFNGALYIAWKGSHNDRFSLMYSNDSGETFGNKCDFAENLTHGLGLAAHGKNLYIAWKGERNDRLIVALVQFSPDAIVGLTNKVILPDISPDSPSLLSLRERIYICWRGDVNKNLNIGYLINNGSIFGGKYKSPETSRHAPALCAHNGVVFISWIDLDNGHINIATM
jgi:predicted heme/steroid binding protein